MKLISGMANAQCVILSLAMSLVLLSFSAPLLSHQTKEECIEFSKSGAMKSLWRNHQRFRKGELAINSFSAVGAGTQIIYPIGCYPGSSSYLAMKEEKYSVVTGQLVLMTLDISCFSFWYEWGPLRDLFPDYDESRAGEKSIFDETTSKDLQLLKSIAENYEPKMAVNPQKYHRNYLERISCDSFGLRYKDIVRDLFPGLEAFLQLTPQQAVKIVVSHEKQNVPSDIKQWYGSWSAFMDGFVELCFLSTTGYEDIVGYKRKMYIICPFGEAAEKMPVAVFQNAPNATEGAEGDTVQSAGFQLDNDAPHMSCAQQ